MDYSKVISQASRKQDTSSRMPVLKTKLPPPKKIVKEKKGVQSAAVRAFLEKKDAEEKQKELDAKKKKHILLKARADANHNRKAHAMASRTKDNLKVYTPEDGENIVNDDDVKVKPEDLSKKTERRAHQVSEDWFQKRQKILERMKKPREPVVEKKSESESKDTKSNGKEKEKSEKHKETTDYHKKRESGRSESSNSQKNSHGSSSKHKHKHKHKHSSKDREKHNAKDMTDTPWISVKKQPVEEPVVETKKLPPKKPKASGPPPMSYQEILRLAQEQKKNPQGNVINGNTTNASKKPEKETRPMTQDEKERAERKKSRGYQQWLKHGGRLPGASIPEKPQKGKPISSALPSREQNQEGHAKSKHRENPGKPKTLPENKSGTSKTIQGHKHKTLNISSSVSNQTNKEMQDKGASKSSVSASKTSSYSSSQKQGVDRQKSSATKITSSENTKRPAATSKRRSEPQSDSEEENFKRKKIKVKEEPQLSTWDRLYGQMHGKKQRPAKRPILPESDYDEYEDEDGDLSDFIDDGDAEADYSSAIKEIFGYDKRKYRYIDEDDVSDMEAGFADVEKEEAISAKIGYMEDLEDIRQEEEEKKRKMMKMKMKKKLKK